MYSFISVLSLSLFLIGSAQAGAVIPIGTIGIENLNITNATLSNGYWTPERMKAAKPLDLPQASGSEQTYVPFEVNRSSNVGVQGVPPQEKANVMPLQLFTPDPNVTSNAIQDSPESPESPQASGTFGAVYTSTRVFPLHANPSASLSADQTYPYRPVGRLFFTIDGLNYVCSGAVIARRVVATAGHCVHSGAASGFYTNWLFVPAYRDGLAPFGVWQWRKVVTTDTWITGGGSVPNAADYAMISFQDQPDALGGITSLGTVTGSLGFQLLSLAGNHTSKLGYPGNLDSGGKMQNITSAAYRQTNNNTVEYGSDARGGSSGGPWVQNFQLLQTGGGTGLNTASNKIVGITSYGYVSPDPKVQGASILDQRFMDLYTTICSAQPGNCTP